MTSENEQKMKLARPGDYYVALRFMADNLRMESGVLRDIFALIYGFSQDGESACACNLKYFMEWTLASERTVRYTLGALEAAGYIFRNEVGSGRGSYVEYRVNPEILDQCKKGAKFAPIKKGANYSRKGGKICR